MNKNKYLQTVGVIGLGIMGGAMAEVLLEAGYQVSGVDPKPAALRRLKKAGGMVLSSAAAVAEQSDVVIVSLATARALAVVVAELAAARPKRKPIIIETSTLPIAVKDAAAAALANAGMRTLDCPISGTAVRLKQGAWTIFVSGDAATARKTRSSMRRWRRASRNTIRLQCARCSMRWRAALKRPSANVDFSGIGNVKMRFGLIAPYV